MGSLADTAPPGEAASPELFLSYHGVDRERVEAVRSQLSERGIRAFLDRHDLVAGLPWPQALEKVLRSVRAVLVFVGSGDGGESLGLWQRREAWFALDRQAQLEGQGESFPVIPVLLPGGRPDAGFLFLNTWVDLRDRADGASAIDAIVRAVGGVSAAPAEGASLTICPYRALEVFREEHAALFFGRESVAGDLLDRVTHRSLVALVGPSGNGKSSVVQAGLIPLLRRQRPPQCAWDAVVFRPGDSPFHRLAAALIPLLEPEADEVDRLELARKLGERLGEGAVRLEDVVDRVIARSNGTGRLLITADQFEEVFTLASAPVRPAFVSAILDALDRAPFAFLLTLRADFYGHAVAIERRLSDRIQAGIVNLGPMTRDELRRAIEQPARRAAIHFEPGLVDRILDHVELQPGGLPLLEFALTQLWERRDGHRITHAAYEAIGEVAGAISRRAEAVFLGLEAKRQRAALGLFTRLVRVAPPNEAEPDTRRRIELATLSESEHEVLGPFVDARLLVLGGGVRPEMQTVEVAHEALLHGWGRLAAWVAERRAFLLWRQRLGQSLAAWETTGHDKGALLRGPALKEALGCVRQHGPDLAPAEAEFIARSRKRTRRRRYALGALIGLLIAVIGAWPAVHLGTRTNVFQVWGSVRVAPIWIVGALPSAIATWAHAMAAASRLDAVGWGMFNAPPPFARLIALEGAAMVMAEEGRQADARRLAERAMKLARESPGFEQSVPGQLDLAAVLSHVGLAEAAQPFARQALALAREFPDPQTRSLGLANAARFAARAGLAREATAAIEEARASFPEGTPPGSRAELDALVGQALVRLGAVDEALAHVTRRSDWPLPPLLVQGLIDGGHLERARELVGLSDDPVVVAMVASALTSADRREEGRALTLRALALVEKSPGGPRVRDEMRALLQERLLLAVMTAAEATAVIRTRGSADEQATFAAVLARSGRPDLARQTALDLARPVQGAGGPPRGRMLVRITEALALSGDAERALSIARTIEERELLAAALAHAAFGFATRGDADQARALVREVHQVLPSIRDPQNQSLVWAAVAMASIRLGRYADAVEDENLNLDPSDRLLVYAAVIRDDLLRRNPERRDILDRRPTQGLGRYGVDWP